MMRKTLALAWVLLVICGATPLGWAGGQRDMVCREGCGGGCGPCEGGGNDAVETRAARTATSEAEGTEKTLAELNEEIRLHPDNGKALYARGLFWMRASNGEKALADFNAALRYDPRNAEILSQRGLIYLKNGAFQQSVADFDAAQANGGSGPEFFSELGMAWWAKGDPGKAIEACNKALASDPPFTPALVLRGLAHFSRGDYSEASADFSRADELVPSAQGEVWKYLAQARAARPPQAQAPGVAAKSENWYHVVLRYLSGGLSGADFLKAATTFPASQQSQLCEAHLFTGEKLLMEAKQAEARDQFRQALEICEKYAPEYLVARYESERLQDHKEKSSGYEY
jgi:tetratricopeptide (TPR) repeat protein